jgi:hypothetical protein
LPNGLGGVALARSVLRLAHHWLLLAWRLFASCVLRGVSFPHSPRASLSLGCGATTQAAQLLRGQGCFRVQMWPPAALVTLSVPEKGEPEEGGWEEGTPPYPQTGSSGARAGGNLPTLWPPLLEACAHGGHPECWPGVCSLASVCSGVKWVGQQPLPRAVRSATGLRLPGEERC